MNNPSPICRKNNSALNAEAQAFSDFKSLTKETEKCP
jgi:hypothetical protein